MTLFVEMSATSLKPSRLSILEIGDLMLIWTFDFLKRDQTVQGGQRILHSRTYVDGVYSEKFNDSDKNTLFLAYLTLFPGKEIVKIRLMPPDSNEYIIHYLEKRFIDNGLIGVLTVQETNTDKPFNTWGSEDLLAQYIFGYYFERVLAGELCTASEILEFHKWLDEEIIEYYKEWLEEREKCFELDNKKVQTENSSADPFWNDVDMLWEFQFINEFGFPITNVIRYKNGIKQNWGSEEEINFQNLESMTISVLKSILDQSKRKMIIDYFKVKLENELGYSYVFFKYMTVQAITVVILLSIGYYNKKKFQMIQYFKGNERLVLEDIKNEIEKNSQIMDSPNRFVDDSKHKLIEDLIEKIINKNIKTTKNINESF